MMLIQCIVLRIEFWVHWTAHMQEEKSYVQVKAPTTKMTLLINGPSCQTPASNCRIQRTSLIVERKEGRKKERKKKRKKNCFSLFLTIFRCLSWVTLFIFEPAHDKTYNKICATSKDSDQLVHPHSMARVLVHTVDSTCDQRRLWSDCADAQSDLSLRWSHKSYCRFCWALAHFGIIRLYDDISFIQIQ